MKTLYRSRTNRMVAGIFGGIGETYNIDPNILRLLYVVLALATGVLPFIILYIIGWVAIPEKQIVTGMTPEM